MSLVIAIYLLMKESWGMRDEDGWLHLIFFNYGDNIINSVILVYLFLSQKMEHKENFTISSLKQKEKEIAILIIIFNYIFVVIEVCFCISRSKSSSSSSSSRS